MISNNRQLLINFISTLISISAIMMLSYIQGKAMARDPNAFPFYMGPNNVIMKRNTEQRVIFEDIIDVDKDTGVLVISRDEDSEVIGVYDPEMVRAFENTYSGAGFTRYFSYDDYVNKTKAGILVSNACDWEYTSENISELLYCTDINSSFNYDGRTKEVVNLASLETLGDYVYLDYGDRQVADRIIKRLQDSGYRRQTLGYIGLLKTLFGSKEFADGVMTGGLVIYAFFGVASFWQFYNDRKKISLHFLHGGTLKKMTGKIMSPFVGLSVLGTIPVLLFSFWQRKTLYMTINNTSLLMFLATHVLITSLMYFLAFYSVFTMIRKSERGDSYVR